MCSSDLGSMMGRDEDHKKISRLGAQGLFDFDGALGHSVLQESMLGYSGCPLHLLILLGDNCRQSTFRRQLIRHSESVDEESGRWRTTVSVHATRCSAQYGGEIFNKAGSTFLQSCSDDLFPRPGFNSRR